MNKYRFTIRSQFVTTVDLDADNEADAYEEIRAYIEDGGGRKLMLSPHSVAGRVKTKKLRSRKS